LSGTPEPATVLPDFAAPEPSPARWRADSALALVALVWGATFVIVKQAITQISALYFLSLRFSLASLCLLLLFLPAFRRMSRRQILRGLRGGFLTGLLLWCGYVLQTFGLRYTSAANSGFLTGLYIVLVPLIGAAIYRQAPSLREISGLSLATMGMVVMTLPGSGSRFSINLGDLLTIACAVAFAFHLQVLGHFSKRESVEAVALGQVACAALLSTGSLAIVKPVAVWSPSVITAIVLTAVFATAMAFTLQTWGQKHTTPTRTALIFALEPVFALVTAIAFGEPARWPALLGGALILAGILAVELKSGGG
jgi:drug/metabolite transporter (DMT)-like permease